MFWIFRQIFVCFLQSWRQIHEFFNFQKYFIQSCLEAYISVFHKNRESHRKSQFLKKIWIWIGLCKKWKQMMRANINREKHSGQTCMEFNDFCIWSSLTLYPIYQDCVWTPCSDGVTRAGPLCGNFRANLAASHTDKLQQP